MSEKKGKVPALVLALPHAPIGWHWVDGLAGLVHPDIPVPHLGAEGFVEAYDERQKKARREWDAHEKKMEAADPPLRVHGRLPFPAEPCPVKVVYVTEKEAEAGTVAHDQARREVSTGLRAARRSGDDVEATLAHNESAALAGGEE